MAHLPADFSPLSFFFLLRFRTLLDEFVSAVLSSYRLDRVPNILCRSEKDGVIIPIPYSSRMYHNNEK